MACELDPRRPLDDQFRDLLATGIDEAIVALDMFATPGDPGQRAAAVHAARKRCKEVRALLRLVTDANDPAARHVDRHVRRAARALAPLRDADVTDQLAAEFGLGSGRPRSDDIDGVGAVTRSIVHLRRAQEQLHQLRLDTSPATLRTGLRRTYRRSRRAYERARKKPSIRHLHRWRTWNKRLWYQVRLLAGAAPLTLDALVALLDAIGEAIGDQHDIAVLLEHAEPTTGIDRVSQERAALEARCRELAERALRWGATAFVETGDAFADRLVGVWSATVENGPEAPLHAAAGSSD